VTHPAQHHVDASKKRQRAWVEGRARGGKSDRPGKAGALKGGASEDRETQSDTRALVPHLRDAKFPPPDTVAGAEEQKERARGGRLASGGPTIPTPPYAGARTADNRVDPSPATADKNEMRQMPSMDTKDVSLAKGGKLTAHERQKMPSKEFALPGKGEGPGGKGAGSYPIPDAPHGRNALARVSQHGSPQEKAQVRAAVHRKFPNIQEG
jgi:hypothetical protein